MGVLLSLLVLLELAQVGLRYVLDSGLFWALEVSLLVLMSLAWLGAAHLWLIRRHLVIDFFGGRWPGVTPWMDGIADLVVIIGAVWLGPQIVEAIGIYRHIDTGSLPLSGVLSLLPMAIGISLMTCAALINVAESWRQSRSTRP